MLDAGTWEYRRRNLNLSDDPRDLSIAIAVCWYQTMFRRYPGTASELFITRERQLFLRRFFLFAAHLGISEETKKGSAADLYKPFCQYISDGFPVRFLLRDNIKAEDILNLLTGGVYGECSQAEWSSQFSRAPVKRFSFNKKNRYYRNLSRSGDLFVSPISYGGVGLPSEEPGEIVTHKGDKWGRFYINITGSREINCWFDEGSNGEIKERAFISSIDTTAFRELESIDFTRSLIGETAESEVLKKVLSSTNNDEMFNALNSLRCSDYFREGRTLIIR